MIRQRKKDYPDKTRKKGIIVNRPKEKWERNYVRKKREEREERKTLKDFFLSF